MTADLLWPGDSRAGVLFTDEAIVAAMVRVETAWLGALHAHGLAPAAVDLRGLVGPADLPGLAEAAEGGGNPVIPLVSLLRERLRPRDSSAAEAVHAGLTSQDVLDTAIVLCLRDVAERVGAELSTQIDALSGLADRHRGTRMAGRTLTQHAIPITFGLKAATWLQAVLDARDTLHAVVLPAQIGGAAGSLAAPTALAGSPERALDLVTVTAAELGLPARPPWHTARAPLTRVADALVTCTDAWGRIANDVLVATRPEVGELTEPAGEDRGGSSAMPQKQNPVLAVLVRRAALAAPPLAATMHLAAAEAVDERPDGSWHVEWATLRTLARRTVVAGSQTAELLTGLRVDAERMAGTLAAARPGIDAERDKVGDEGPYLGATDRLIDAALDRAREKPC
ncbi:3-carboxy-cis,cis-muconate cycloisomerase [Paractinoplanes ferrugineus]|uniref:3-carboxy-cis,cis-muconate cycloisomerase n=1 Tax=Paractinoplanes ferrugineus TaxID=113564 RepID=A0A919MDP2_9ACTN|nr:lyase family protein [Actinoplanes ferrugineus]GIE16006.1 3-carboxy-cis,cis-muconate cycloisomerase [Actinoplanes ferrugineus]